MENLSIFELRHIAGELGIKYPSRLKRDDLIAEIRAVKCGEREVTPKSNRGRPKKPLTTVAPDKRLVREAVQMIDESVAKLSKVRADLEKLLVD